MYAIEPLPSCQQYLQDQLAHDRKSLAEVATVIPKAVGDNPGTSEFTVAEDWLPFSGFKRVPYPEDSRTTTITVDVETIDSLFVDLPSLAYIKIDAEGAELQILRGAVESISQHRPVVAFEFGTISNREFGVGPSDMFQYWESLDYTVYAITGECLDANSFEQKAQAREIWDYVAVPVEDKPRQRIVENVLRRARVNWLAVRAELNHANDHADVGTQVPPFRKFRGPLRPFAWSMGWLFLQIAKIVTIPQRFCNRAILNAMQLLVNDLERTERENRRMDRTIQELEQRIEEIEKRYHKEMEKKRNPW
ncbi:MAG: FkbM family methyltransferase [Gemmataceae bacterium]